VVLTEFTSPYRITSQ